MNLLELAGVTLFVGIGAVVLRSAIKAWNKRDPFSKYQKDPEFSRRLDTLKTFMDAQELLLRASGDGELRLDSREEKERYLFFMLGAIDFLSRTIKGAPR